MILFASLFHSSAIIILPFGLMATKKTDSKIFIAFCIAIFVSSIYLWQLWDAAFRVLDLLGRDKIVESYGSLTEEAAMGTGVNILRILVFGLPTLLGIVFYRQLQEQNKHYYLILNFNIFSTLLMFAASRTWYIARLAYYFNVAMPLLLIELLNIVTEDSKTLFKYLMVFLFLIYIWVSLHTESRLLPYYFTIGNHVRVFN